MRPMQLSHFQLTVVLAGLIGFLLTGPGPSQAAPPATVANGATPREGTGALQLTELWRIGGPDDEENLLGVVSQVLADADHNIYLLDIQLTEVQVYDSDGIYARSLGKRGDGPGELRFATDALFLPDGTLGLVQPFPGKIIKVDLDGVPAGELRPGGDDPTQGGFFAIRSAAAQGDEVVISGMKISRGESSRTAKSFVGRIDMAGDEGVRFLEKTSVREFGNRRIVEKDEYFPHEHGWALAPDGRVAIAPARNEYRLEIHGPDGTLQRVVTREYQPVKRTAAELERAESQMMPWRRRNRDRIEFVMEPTEPDLVQFHFTGDGRLWVLPSRGVRDQAAGVHSTWDVFDPAGNFERQVAVVCDAAGLQDAIFFPGGDRVVVVKQYRDALQAFQGRGPGAESDTDSTDEASPLEVICYRITPE